MSIPNGCFLCEKRNGVQAVKYVFFWKMCEYNVHVRPVCSYTIYSFLLIHKQFFWYRHMKIFFGYTQTVSLWQSHDFLLFLRNLPVCCGQSAMRKNGTVLLQALFGLSDIYFGGLFSAGAKRCFTGCFIEIKCQGPKEVIHIISDLGEIIMIAEWSQDLSGCNCSTFYGCISICSNIQLIRL